MLISFGDTLLDIQKRFQHLGINWLSNIFFLDLRWMIRTHISMRQKGCLSAWGAVMRQAAWRRYEDGTGWDRGWKIHQSYLIQDASRCFRMIHSDDSDDSAGAGGVERSCLTHWNLNPEVQQKRELFLKSPASDRICWMMSHRSII